MAHEIITLVKYKGNDVGRETKVFKHVFEGSMKAKGKRSAFAGWLPKADIDELEVAEETLEEKVAASNKVIKEITTPKTVQVAPTDEEEDDLNKQLDDLEDVEETDNHVDVNSLKFFALKKYAKDKGVEVTPKMKKADLLEKLKEIN